MTLLSELERILGPQGAERYLEAIGQRDTVRPAWWQRVWAAVREWGW